MQKFNLLIYWYRQYVYLMHYITMDAVLKYLIQDGNLHCYGT